MTQQFTKDQIEELVEKLSEWSGYVTEDFAHMTLEKHIRSVFEAMGIAAAEESAGQVPKRPTKAGWYVILPPDFDEPKVRAFGRDGRWWIPLGRGNGDDGWMSSIDYQNWVGPIADIDDRQPFLTKTATATTN